MKALKVIWTVYKGLFFMLAPFLISFLPVAAALMFSESYAWFSFLSFPCGMASVYYFWEKKLFELLDNIGE